MLVGMNREDVAAALAPCWFPGANRIWRSFASCLRGHFRNPEAAQQLLSQLLPGAPEAARPRHRPACLRGLVGDSRHGKKTASRS